MNWNILITLKKKINKDFFSSNERKQKKNIKNLKKKKSDESYIIINFYLNKYIKKIEEIPSNFK